MDDSRSAGRIVVCFASLSFALGVTASLMYEAAAGVSHGPSVEPSLLLAAGTRGASLIRWGSLIDKASYLCMAPVALYLRHRFPDAAVRRPVRLRRPGAGRGGVDRRGLDGDRGATAHV